MQVILVQDVANLGYKNDIVKVKDGYGRNYLIPNKLAIIANDSNVKQLNENLKQQAKKLAQQLANEDGKIFGTVTTAQIADALAAQGFDIDRKIITVEPVKELGEAVATARLHREVKAEIKLNVVAE